MKKVLLLVIFGLMCFSCNFNKSKKGLYFDMSSYVENKSKWQNAGLENYSFTYSVSTYRPEYIIGEVTVKNNACESAEIYINDSDLESTPVNPSDKFYLNTIDAAFDFIYHEYEDASKVIESKEYQYVEIVCEYDDIYGYPVLIRCLSSDGTEVYKKGLTGNSETMYSISLEFTN